MPAPESHIQDEGQPPQSTDAASYTLNIPKNRSTGNLLSQAGNNSENARIRFSFDAGSTKKHDPTSMSSIAAEQDVASGLRRIRQLPPSRFPSRAPSRAPSGAPSHSSSPNASFSIPHRASSMTLGLSTSRTWASGGPSSPTMNHNEDLSRFPSESLHSFSFAHLSEDVLRNRQNILKRSIDFLRDKLGWTSSHPGLINAQAKVSGDAEVQSMMELLSKANILGIDTVKAGQSRFLNGPLTGPAITNGSNVFENAFKPPIQNSEQIRARRLSQPHKLNKENMAPSRSSSSHPEPSLSSEATAAEISEPHSPRESLSALGPSQTLRQQGGHKRTYTDLSLLTLQTKLVEALAKPYAVSDGKNNEHLLSPTPISAFGKSANSSAQLPWAVHGHPNRSAPPAQAIFTTENAAPWTILAANDLACLVIGITKGELRKLSIFEVVRQDKRSWLEDRLKGIPLDDNAQTPSTSGQNSRRNSGNKSLTLGNGVTAQLLSKPSSREVAKQKARSASLGGARSPSGKNIGKGPGGVLLCGDVVPIQKRNGATGAASLWVKEKGGGLVWVLEEISEDTACLGVDDEGRIQSSTGSLDIIFGELSIASGTKLRELIPHLPMSRVANGLELDFKQITDKQYFAARNAKGASLPVSIFASRDHKSIQVSSFPHIAGIVVLTASTLAITSSNSAFSAALFGLSNVNGLNITALLPRFDKLLEVLADEEEIDLMDGMVIPEHMFRKARDLLTLRDADTDPASTFLKPPGLAAKHHDGSDINVDVQMRIVRSEKTEPDEDVIEEIDEDATGIQSPGNVAASTSELVYALWITYSRQLHTAYHARGSASPVAIRSSTPLPPSPGQNNRAVSPQPADSDDNKSDTSPTTSLRQQIQEATSQPISDPPNVPTVPMAKPAPTSIKQAEPAVKKKITDFAILEDMGQGAYGQVKLARYNKTSKKVVLKYVTKKRILVDTWTRDRRLGTVPLEIHVLDYLRKDGLKHPNIVEMLGFFEDDINYYIEMVPHGLPGMDLFDYIEMRPTMDEAECRHIFLEVVAALHHLHTKALVVHRDIKDENIILDGENKVKLIDFGSAAYIKNGPFDVFVGTIDYAAPEVLQGKSYRGKEQDVWALGILLYTLIYKENPFYSIDEIMDHELRIPWIMSEASIDLIKAMLNREVDQRLTISQVMEHPWCTEPAKAEEQE
ncbi:MAG: hypothetical protein LQ337_003214 [Flavoplaca oasis]|nr:MAG: hypothetical protein LQ337_003214 [Flavoplaca oasis]